MKRFAIVCTKTGKIVWTYEATKIIRETGGCDDITLFEHFQLPTGDYSLWKYDWTNNKFAVDQELKLAQHAKMVMVLKEQLEYHLWRYTDWSQLGDAPLTEQEKLVWRQYRTFLRGYENMVGDLSSYKSPPAIPMFDEWKAKYCRN